MGNICDWTEGALMPVITREKKWSPSELDGLLTEAINRCYYACFVVHSGNIATTISGGIDSSFCLSRLSKLGSSTCIYTFTVGGDKKHPDISHAKMASKLFNTIHTEIIPSKRRIAWAKKKLSKIRPTEKITMGDAAVFLAYQSIADRGFKISIAHDGIDELLGGYWKHRDVQTKSEKKMAFQRFWAELIPCHLVPLEKSARYFGIKVLFPYLQPEIVEYISHIPVNERTRKKVSKIPLREIASKCLPQEIVERKKFGFCSALDKK